MSEKTESAPRREVTMDTKALDHFFDNGNWQSGGEGDWEYEGGIDPQQACAELKILHEELGLLHDTALRQEQDKRQLRAELDADKIAFDEGKDVIRKYHEKLDQLCAELDEALELAEEGWGYASPYFQEKWSFKERLAELKAKAHPERK